MNPYTWLKFRMNCIKSSASVFPIHSMSFLKDSRMVVWSISDKKIDSHELSSAKTHVRVLSLGEGMMV